MLLLHNFEALEQFLLVGTEYLDADGVLCGCEKHFATALFGVAVEGLGGYELGDEEVGSKLFAELAEREVGDVVHG